MDMKEIDMEFEACPDPARARDDFVRDFNRRQGHLRWLVDWSWRHPVFVSNRQRLLYEEGALDDLAAWQSGFPT